MMKRSLRSWLWGVPLDREVAEELDLHVELRIRELVERGIDPKAAREMAMARLGDVRRLERTCMDIGRKRDREMRLTQWIDERRDDVRFAVRQLKASPAFALVAVTTLALGIGANSAIFAVSDAVLIRPLPFEQPDRLVLVSERFGPFDQAVVAPLNLRDWNERNRTFEAMAGMSYGGAARSIVGPDGLAEQIPGFRVTANFFDVLGVTPIAGRTFVPGDVTSKADVVVLNEGLWRTRFGGDPAIIGRPIEIDGRAFTVIGIAPASAQALGRSSLWTPYLSPPGIDERAAHFMRVIGRLKADATVEAARADITLIADALAREYPATNKGRGVSVDPLRDWLVGREVRLTSALLLGVVGFVLLMCCANIANLLLARTSARARELAVRSALGAGRRRIVAQILTESLVLALAGGAIGLVTGAVILRVAASAIPEDLLPAAITLAFDGRVVAFCATASALVGLLFGAVPAWQATGMSLVQVMSSDSRTATTRGGLIRRMLVAWQVATAVLLLCGAGLLLRTLVALDRVDAGYRADNVLTMQINLPGGVPGSRYPTSESMRRFYESVGQEVATLPGVKRVAWGGALPLDHQFIGELSFEIVGDPPLVRANRPLADYQIVSPAYFESMGIPMVRGRSFTDRDAASSVQVCIVNEAFVRRHLQGRDPLGLRIVIGRALFGLGASTEREIVGVVRQVKGRPAEADEPVHVYVPLAQDAWVNASLVVEPAGGPAGALAAAVRGAVARVDGDVPVARVRTMDDVAWNATSRQRFRAALVMMFGALALALAMVGVFGVLAYAVQQRERELGVRMALGATTGNVLRLVLASAARVIGAGVVIGLAAAAALGQSIAVFLFGVQPLDPVTFVSVVLVLAVTAAIAAAAPALRATRVDPVVAFRSE